MATRRGSCAPPPRGNEMAAQTKRQSQEDPAAIPLCVPQICGNEWSYVKECLDGGWVSSAGSYVGTFEERIAAAVGSRFGVAATSGTAALHVATGAHCRGDAL